MPNHCMNKLGIIGPTKDVQDFIELVTNNDEATKEQDKYELFKNLIPMPKELEGTTSSYGRGKNQELVDKYGYDNWYDWCLDKWGTKWGDYELSASEIRHETSYEFKKLENGETDYDSGVEKLNGKSSIHFDYTTAWSPGADELAEAIVNRFPNLNGFIYYEEPGMGFAGQLVFSKGEIDSHNQWEYHQAYEDVSDVYFEEKDDNE